MTEKKRGFGDLEFTILNLFRKGVPLTVKEVHQQLGGGDKYNTIMTVMSRLAEKGQLQRERKGLQYSYWIPEAPKPSLIQQLKRKLFGIKPVELLCCLLDDPTTLSEQEIEQMEKALLEARQKKRLT